MIWCHRLDVEMQYRLGISSIVLVLGISEPPEGGSDIAKV